VLLTRLAELYPNFAYAHLVEPRVAVGNDGKVLPSHESLDFARKLWAPRPMLIAGGYTPEDALERATHGEKNGENVVIVFGRYFIANPDLPARIRNGVKLNEYNRDTFYLPKSRVGYIDYPFAEQL